MTRKSVLVGTTLALVLSSSAGAVLAALLRHEPAFFKRMDPEADPLQSQWSSEVYAELSRLFTAIQYDKEWYGRFTDRQINGYIQEESLRSKLEDLGLPDGVTDPRIAVEDGEIRLGFRYGKGSWSTIISLNLRVWLVPRKINTVALEVRRVSAGSLPISAHSFLERISDVARRRNIEVTWYRHQGHPVALVQFQADQPRPTAQLQQLELRQGTILFGGRSIDTTPVRAMATPEGPLQPNGN